VRYSVGDDPVRNATGAGGNIQLHSRPANYQGIEYCIDKKLQRFEPGTQGEQRCPGGRADADEFAHFRRRSALPRPFATSRHGARGRPYAARENEHVTYQRAVREELQL